MIVLKFNSSGNSEFPTLIHSPEGRVNKQTIILSNPSNRVFNDYIIFTSDCNKELNMSGSLIAEIKNSALNGDIFLNGKSGNVLVKENVRKALK